MSLDAHWSTWEDLGRVDPFWAVLTDPARRHGRWDPAEFFATGETAIAALMERAEGLGMPRERNLAFDFGCGLGRMAKPLASRFQNYVGVDISAPMIARAQEWNHDCTRCRFVLNITGDLSSFETGSVDLLHTRYVLQHLPTKALMRHYILEFVRILKPGGLIVFQLPCHISLAHRIQPRRRLYTLLRRLGVSEQVMLGPLRLSPMVMRSMSERHVERLITSLGARLVQSDHFSNTDHVYYATR
jgi:SAM-dependent methyltransferase